MTEINSGIAEQQAIRRERLLYHGSTRVEAARLIAEHGLLADKVTLTPVLELAMDYARGGETLTCWYPKRGEHSGMGSLGPTQPTTPLTEDQRAEIKAKIEQSDVGNDVKQSYLGIVDRARTFLPNTRLGAIVTPGSNIEWAKLSSFNLSRMEDYLKKYVSNREAMVSQKEELLRKAKKIIFIDPKLNIGQLADDMVRTEVEHYLLNIGYNLRLAKNRKEDVSGDIKYILESYLEELQSVQFQEPEYERYRKMLVSSISK